MIGTCQTCRWWDVSTADVVDADLSPCKAQPPVVQINMRRGVWPMVDAEDWCSNHVERPQPQPQPPESNLKTCEHGFEDEFECPDCRPF